MQRHLITALILVAALGLYGAGLTGLGTAAFIAGSVFELWFWLRVFSKREDS